MKLSPNVIIDPIPATRPEGTFLIIDDDHANSRLVASLLKRRGLHCLIAASPAEAISLWNRHESEITLVIADASLQADGDGFEVAHRFKKEKPGLKLIFGSWHPRSHFEADAEAEDVNFLEKPFNSSALVAILHGCLTHHSIAR